jgi:ribosomal protein S12 methylthiotransferase
METQAAVSAARLARRVGRTIDVLVDRHEDTGRGKSKRRVAIARSAAEAPEIDGVVRVEDGGDLPVGSFARVRVRAAGPHDLDAVVA